MYQVYFDASITPESTPRLDAVHTLGAYMGHPRAWESFRDQWSMTLEKYGLSFFHMTDFEFARSRLIARSSIPSRSQFRNWPRDRFVQFLQELHDVINSKDESGDYRFIGWAASLKLVDFDIRRPKDLETHPLCSSYYIFNLTQILKSLALALNYLDYIGPIRYVFSAGDREGQNLQRLFDFLCQREEWLRWFRLDKRARGSLYEIISMKSEPALQAADLVTFEMHKSNITMQTNDGDGLSLKDLRASWQSLGKAPHVGIFSDINQLMKVFDEISRNEIVL